MEPQYSLLDRSLAFKYCEAIIVVGSHMEQFLDDIFTPLIDVCCSNIYTKADLNAPIANPLLSSLFMLLPSSAMPL
eukprot:15365452-Ditylum_brightwellii.AAC.1